MFYLTFMKCVLDYILLGSRKRFPIKESYLKEHSVNWVFIFFREWINLNAIERHFEDYKNWPISKQMQLPVVQLQFTYRSVYFTLNKNAVCFSNVWHCLLAPSNNNIWSQKADTIQKNCSDPNATHCKGCLLRSWIPCMGLVFEWCFWLWVAQDTGW